MEDYKFDKRFRGRIEPIPGAIVEVDGTRLKVVEGGPGEGCQSCVLDNPYCHVDMNHELLAMLCMHTTCDGVIRADGINIHYEEVKDGQ